MAESDPLGLLQSAIRKVQMTWPEELQPLLEEPDVKTHTHAGSFRIHFPAVERAHGRISGPLMVDVHSVATESQVTCGETTVVEALAAHLTDRLASDLKDLLARK
ncbi:MAG: hypothetical protein NT029_17495 [Armatimonadetes bacterium]|nr:hypothetical protein [Armatimonadota bacterium]